LAAYPIECNALCKRFGDLAAVEALTFKVEPGSVTGFVGHNGAGKTTTLRMLLGLARPTSGGAFVLGNASGGRDRSHLARLGYLPESPAFYRWMTPREFLSFTGNALGMERKAAGDRTGEMLETFGLASKGSRKIAGFSKGERQRLGLAQAMMGEPELLLLDEPTSGLDPLGRHELLSLIAGIRGELTIFFSSHILADVEEVCDHVVMISHGELVAAGPLPQVLERHSRPSLVVRVRGGAGELARALEERDWAGAVIATGGAVRLEDPDMERAERELPRLISALDLSLSGLERGGVSLEEVYLELTEVGDEG
jgi:ABC-2 type transport system ATP-binding protein